MLADLAAEGRPFFLFSSYWKPHGPFEAPEPWASMYDDADIPLPAPVGRDYIESLPLPVQKMILRSDPPPYDMDRDRLRWIYRSYYGTVSQIDREVGLTVAALDELGLADDTVVIFCSDHGDQLLEHGLLGKNVFFAGSVRVPLMIRRPGVVPPGEPGDLIETTDVLPTLFELCGLDVPGRSQGRSFARAITGGAVGSAYEPRRYVFAENIIPEVITGIGFEYPYVPGEGVGGVRHPDAKMVRSERYKYCRYVGHGAELYDLRDDPGEMRNLAADPAHAGVVREMEGALLDWLSTCDEGDQIAPRWREV
jgi:arylsulfatase A-like enzyme